MSEAGADVQQECRFCIARNEGRRLLIEGELGYAAYDRYPASPGHFLVIPYRHFDSYFDIQQDELIELWNLVAKGKKLVDEAFSPDGYNVGINVGEAAGQSVFHLHIHVIPRYRGDVEIPKGGVRGVIPSKKLYTIDPDRRA